MFLQTNQPRDKGRAKEKCVHVTSVSSQGHAQVCYIKKTVNTKGLDTYVINVCILQQDYQI